MAARRITLGLMGQGCGSASARWAGGRGSEEAATIVTFLSRASRPRPHLHLHLRTSVTNVMAGDN
ncbi:hypothetical protein ACFYZH_11695 [Streptomyces abikoensis]|uniref:hypothetical protein n=1 Tax=Streptomyces abikoensis TaxID=97398 RepID=UPI003694A288